MRRIIGIVIALALACIGWTSPALAAGTLKVAIPSNLNTLDPAKTKIGEEYIVNFLVFSGLTEIDRSGNHIFALDTSTFPVFAFGYARVTSARAWYVTLRKTTFVTIGAVSFRGPGVWDAYCGLDGHARWFGYATGPHAGIGAVALLLDFGACGT